ncbi:hypothetical protein Dimus_038597 [Dionaea muscipula]
MDIDVLPYLGVRRKMLFYTRCQVGEKVLSMIIDRGVYVNVASSTIVEKLGLPTLDHPRPYVLDENEVIKVRKQVSISFRIGRYEDVVVFDVVPMHISHLMLGRPWRVARQVKHDKVTNKYSFVFNDRLIILRPLSPEKICKDQLFVKEQREEQEKQKEMEKEKSEKENKNWMTQILARDDAIIECNSSIDKSV